MHTAQLIVNDLYQDEIPTARAMGKRYASRKEKDGEVRTRELPEGGGVSAGEFTSQQIIPPLLLHYFWPYVRHLIRWLLALQIPLDLIHHAQAVSETESLHVKRTF